MTSSALRRVATSLGLLLALASAARAEGPPPAALAPAPVPDAVFRAVVGRLVELRLLDGQRATGQMLTLEAETAVLALPDGRVTAIPRAQVLDVRLATAAAGAPPASAVVLDLPRADRPPDIEPTERHFGLQFGLGPGVLALDLAYGAFYGFLSGSLALPMYSLGTNKSLGGFTLAPGVSFKIADDRNWRFDLFVHGSLVYLGHEAWYGSPGWTSVDGSLGVGVGFHYTSASGFTAGFKVPVVGFCLGGDVNDLRSAGGYYYLSALLSFPLATLGYRF